MVGVRASEARARADHERSLDDIKFEHTVFALPFAYMGMLLAAGAAALAQVLWITVAMVSARTLAMSANR